jgi:hypothetical protein
MLTGIDKIVISKFFIYESYLNILEISTSWLWSYGSWNFHYLSNQCLSPLMLWVRISIRARCTTLCDKVCQWLSIGQWFPPPINWPPWYNWNIVENGVKHHQTNKQTNWICYADLLVQNLTKIETLFDPIT